MTRVLKGVGCWDIHYPEYDEVLWVNILKAVKRIKPDVFIFGGDNLNMSAVDHWLHERGLVRQLEGRRIMEEYKGFDRNILTPLEKILPPHCRKIWLEGNHECLDADTELLTERGWIKYNEIKPYDRVLSSNNGQLEWVPIDKVIIRYFEGELLRINTKTIDLLATENHKIFYKTRNGKFSFKNLGKLTGSRYLIQTSGIVEKPEYPINDNIIKIIAWLLTDGHINKNGYITFYQSGKKRFLITDILDKLEIPYKVYQRKRNIKEIAGVRLKSVKPQFEIRLNAENSRKLLQYIDKDKSVPSWVEKLNKRQFDLFLNSLIDGDGSRHKGSEKTSWMLYGKKEFLDKIQSLCIQNGYSASLSVYRKTQYRLNICPRQFYHFEKKEIRKEQYKGIVWDLTVKNHNFMIRRNGKAHFTGNCWIDLAIDRNPQGEGYWEIENNLHLKERGWEVYEYNKPAKVGKLYFVHGEFVNQYHAKKMVDVYERNVVYGHTHTFQVYVKTSAIDNEPHMAMSVPVVSMRNPDYRRNKASAWVNGFLIFYVWSNGNFNLYPVIAINGHFVLPDGKKI